VISFTGAYHGLGYGALNATHREYFRGPFKTQLRQFGRAVKWPGDLEKVESEIRKLAVTKNFGAILVEPIQARGGIRVPPPGFLKLLRRLCDRFGLLLILDEIYTGFGRTGAWFACEHEEVVPDLICLGKALSGGFPISACVGRADFMDRAWPRSHGEALHTSTFLGHPVGCAMALAQIDEISKLIEPARSKGEFLKKLYPAMRGVGLMAGIEVESGAVAIRAIKRLLRDGYIFLPEGAEGQVISFTPPLVVSEAQIKASVATLKAALA
jgi:acetylornithine/succinyldiaminopimelate/putrescine aminotransferase